MLKHILADIFTSLKAFTTMIVYGSRSKQLLKEHLFDKCPNCNTPNSIDMHVFQKYAHVFWIPFFPIGKTGISQCDHCKQVLKVKEMPAALAASYQELKARTKTPVWTFSGIAVVAALVVLGIISDKKKDARNAQLILTPRAGDIFEIKTEASRYTIYRVTNVVNDSVFVQPSNYEVNKVTGLNKLKEKDYSDERFGFSKAELKELLNNGEIIDIDRK